MRPIKSFSAARIASMTGSGFPMPNSAPTRPKMAPTSSKAAPTISPSGPQNARKAPRVLQTSLMCLMKSSGSGASPLRKTSLVEARLVGGPPSAFTARLLPRFLPNGKLTPRVLCLSAQDWVRGMHGLLWLENWESVAESTTLRSKPLWSSQQYLWYNTPPE